MTQAEQFVQQLNAAAKRGEAALEMAMIQACAKFNAQEVARMPGLYQMSDGSRAQRNWRHARIEGTQPFKVVVSS